VAIDTSIKEKVFEALTAYLDGSRSGIDVSEWATQVVVSSDFDRRESPLVKETLENLMIVGHDDPRWDTPRKDLENLRDCFLGKKKYVAPVVRETHA
jgi:hypothetical protein